MFDSYLFIGLLALTVATLGIIITQSIFNLAEAKKNRLTERLAASQAVEHRNESLYGSITLKSRPDDPLAKWGPLQTFAKRLSRAYPDIPMSRFVTLVLAIAGMGFILTLAAIDSLLIAVMVALAAAAVPVVLVLGKCSARKRQVDDQLPEALDFLARILRAGHSLATGLQMGASELPDPIASEFRRCYDQHSLGHTLEDAMHDMAQRVDTSDFAFFVTAVLIQRTTGGDLAEVLTNIGSMVRARIRLAQHVKAITAEGRLVGAILLVLPILFFMVLYSINPNYARVLLDTTEGNWALGIAVAFQILGVITIKKIVSVKM